MKLIIAVIQPTKLNAVRDALNKIEVTRMTVCDAQGYARQRGQTELYRGHEYKTQLLRKIALEIAELAKPNRVWNVTHDVVADLHDSGRGNPHSDHYGNRDVWHFYDRSASSRKRRRNMMTITKSRTWPGASPASAAWAAIATRC